MAVTPVQAFVDSPIPLIHLSAGVQQSTLDRHTLKRAWLSHTTSVDNDISLSTGLDLKVLLIAHQH